MFIVKWLKPNGDIYYRYYKSLYGAHTDEYPYIGYMYIGYKNGFDHEIIDINFVYNNKVWTYEEYSKRTCFESKKGLKRIFKNPFR